MGLKAPALKKVRSVYGFASKLISMKDFITLSMILDNDKHTTIKMVEFLIINHLTTYNAIFGKSIMQIAKNVVATFCMMVKFPTPIGK